MLVKKFEKTALKWKQAKISKIKFDYMLKHMEESPNFQLMPNVDEDKISLDDSEISSLMIEYEYSPDDEKAIIEEEKNLETLFFALEDVNIDEMTPSAFALDDVKISENEKKTLKIMT